MSLSSFIPERDGGEYAPALSREEYDTKYGLGDRDLIEIEVDGEILEREDNNEIYIR